ncbi:MAG: DsrE family protein [Thermoplasmata archaeon]
MLLFRRPPYGSVYPAEGLRVAKAILAFQVCLRVVFIEDGVYNLVRGQGGGELGFGDLGAAFAELSGMGLGELCVVGVDLEARGLRLEELVGAPIRIITPEELRGMIEEARAVVPF